MTTTDRASFQDTAQRNWEIKLTLGLIDRVKAATKFDLLAETADVSHLLPLLFNPRLLVDVLWVVVQKQSDSQSTTREQFIDSLEGESMSAGWNALVEAYIDFNPAQVRGAMQAGLESQMDALQQGSDALAQATNSDEAKRVIAEGIGKLKAELMTELPTLFAPAN